MGVANAMTMAIARQAHPANRAPMDTTANRVAMVTGDPWEHQAYLVAIFQSFNQAVDDAQPVLRATGVILADKVTRVKKVNADGSEEMVTQDGAIALAHQAQLVPLELEADPAKEALPDVKLKMALKVQLETQDDQEIQVTQVLQDPLASQQTDQAIQEIPETLDHQADQETMETAVHKVPEVDQAAQAMTQHIVDVQGRTMRQRLPRQLSHHVVSTRLSFCKNRYDTTFLWDLCFAIHLFKRLPIMVLVNCPVLQK